MNPHTTTPPRPSSLQWKVGKPVRQWPRLLVIVPSIPIIILICVLAVQQIATRRAVHACNIGHTSCRLSMGYSRALIDSEDANEDQTVCGDGWRACVDAASEGNIQ